MGMKFMQTKIVNLKFLKPAGDFWLYILKLNKGRGGNMVKTIAKIAEKTAKNSSSSCWVLGIFHQPKMPASLIKKDK